MNSIDEKTLKRKLVLNRETLVPLQRSHLGLVAGGGDNLMSAIGESAASGSVASAAVTLVATESGGACAAASAVASGVASAVDHVSNKMGLPCWAATSVASGIVHFTRRW